jgi:predicted ATPase
VSKPVLKSIEIEGFLSIRSATVELGQLNVLVGANGAGKSNFVRAFELLGRLADQELGLFVGLNGGASALLNGRDDRIRLAVATATDGYEATLLAAANEELIFGSETLHNRHAQRGAGRGGGHRESHLGERDRISALLRGCRVCHFQDTSQNAPVKQFTSVADNIVLRNNAGNLAALLLNLRSSSEGTAYRRTSRRCVRWHRSSGISCCSRRTIEFGCVGSRLAPMRTVGEEPARRWPRA